MSEELVVLAKRLISFETCEPDAISEAAGFIQGWLEARGIETKADEVRGLPVVMAEVGPQTPRRWFCTGTSTWSLGTPGSSCLRPRAIG